MQSAHLVKNGTTKLFHLGLKLCLVRFSVVHVVYELLPPFEKIVASCNGTLDCLIGALEQVQMHIRSEIQYDNITMALVPNEINYLKPVFFPISITYHNCPISQLQKVEAMFCAFSCMCPASSQS